jgi:hypothetical protein
VKKITNCEHCGSSNIFYYATMILKVYGTMKVDGTVDEPTDCDARPLKYKITGYNCMDCEDRLSGYNHKENMERIRNGLAREDV